MPFTKDFQISPLGQRGGLATYPVAGVVSGLKLGLTGSGIKAGAGNEEIIAATVSAGTARFDGYSVSLPSNLTLELDTGVALASAEGDVFPIWLKPKRLSTIFTSAAPSVGADGSYTIKAHLVDGGVYGKYYIAEQIYIAKSNAWVELDAFKGFKQDKASWNNMPFNEIDPSAIVAGDFGFENEYPVFLDSSLPPHVPSYKALLRQSGGILLGEITFSGGTGTITKTMPEYYLLPV